MLNTKKFTYQRTQRHIEVNNRTTVTREIWLILQSYGLFYRRFLRIVHSGNAENGRQLMYGKFGHTYIFLHVRYHRRIRQSIEYEYYSFTESSSLAFYCMRAYIAGKSGSTSSFTSFFTPFLLTRYMITQKLCHHVRSSQTVFKVK